MSNPSLPTSTDTGGKAWDDNDDQGRNALALLARPSLGFLAVPVCRDPAADAAVTIIIASVLLRETHAARPHTHSKAHIYKQPLRQQAPPSPCRHGV